MPYSTLVQGAFLATFTAGTVLLVYWTVRCFLDLSQRRHDDAIVQEADAIIARCRAENRRDTDVLTEQNKDFLEEATRDL